MWVIHLERRVSPYIERERRLAAQRTAEIEAHRALLHERADLILDRLVQYGASRVCLFSSVARGRVRSTSDLDMAVEGLALSSDQLLALAEGDEPYVPMDLVNFDRCDQTLRRRVLQEGRLLYDRGKRTEG